ncbi:hypothetical protein [Paenibacillus pini]|uniref:Uncharacterized protein n=1 Tax=Paenibacillus pini JCM 16418 TaxID=1236976 RepID=W7Z2G6_9BACL|nr:hypothetical protein [Paenibacillus pini]GAF08584.1 hypothetical protein JCM16418_2668 [Paenibacillus pini JCM 16418]
MKWLEAFEVDLRYVFEESEFIITKFPESFREQGLLYLQSFHALGEGSSKNYICYLLPFWMSDMTNLSNETCRRLSVGNIFAMLYFFIQDDIMDTRLPPGKEKLALANLYYITFLEIYHSFFPSDSPFWHLFQQYIYEWCVGVTSSYGQENVMDKPLRLAAKASPIKLSSTAALLLAKQPELITPVSDLLDHVLVTLQMADDWADWREDLEQDSDNGLLSMIHSLVPHTSQLSYEVVHQYITLKSAMKLYVNTATLMQEYVIQTNLPLPHLISFHTYLLNALQKDAENIEEEKNSLQKGGLYHWISKNALGS